MKISYRAKLLLAITLITIVTALAIGFAFLKRAETIVENNYVKSTLSTMSASIGSFDEQIQQAYNTAVTLEFDETLREKLRSYGQGPVNSTAAREISLHLQAAFPGQTLVESVYVYLPGEKQVITSVEYSPVREVFYPDRHAWLTEWPQARSTSLAPQLVYDEIRRLPQHTLAFVRPIVQEDASLLGVVAVCLNERKLFYQCLSAMGEANEDAYYLLDSSATVASAAKIQAIGSPIGEILDAPAGFAQSSETATIQGDMLLTSVTSPLTHFVVVGVTDRSQMVAQLRGQQMFIALILVAALALMLIPAVAASRRVYRPIEKLREAMQAVSRGNLSARAEVMSSDEIGQLSEGFNEMVEQIEGLIEDLIQEQLQTKQAELEALQYQITPHFMYNTLNSIKYAAHLQQAPIIAEQLGAFIDLLQASINRRGALIPVQEEIGMVENYVKLQQFRYMNLFTVSYSIAPAAKGCLVPSLILQPLVENAILHGQREGGVGIAIRVGAAVEGGQLVLSVEDDGKGMTPEQVRHLLTNPKKPKEGFSSIGISNINDRLHLFFAGKADLRYDSRVGEGTTAVIRLPVTTQAPSGASAGGAG